MLKRSRPREHRRNVRTRSGYKVIWVNKGIRPKKKIHLFNVKKIRYFEKTPREIAYSRGMVFPDADVIFLSDEIPKKDRNQVLQHEIGHILDSKRGGDTKFDVISRELRAGKYAFKKEPVKHVKYILKNMFDPNRVKNAYKLYLTDRKNRLTRVLWKDPKDAKLADKLFIEARKKIKQNGVKKNYGSIPVDGDELLLIAKETLKEPERTIQEFKLGDQEAIRKSEEEQEAFKKKKEPIIRISEEGKARLKKRIEHLTNPKFSPPFYWDYIPVNRAKIDELSKSKFGKPYTFLSSTQKKELKSSVNWVRWQDT